MKSKLKYLLVLYLFVCTLNAQVKQLNLKHGGSQLFNGNLYVFGFSGAEQKASLYLYKLNFQLHILDSVVVDLSKTKSGNYLAIHADTLHDYLNVYLQKKESKAVTILRFTKKPELVTTIEDVDVARLNNTSVFSADCIYYKNSVYSVKTNSYTSGKQFYINKYILKSETDNFDYVFQWQFPFERKNVQSAHLFLATSRHIFVHAVVNGGLKSGQWILKLDAETGRLIKGIKLNEKGENANYTFGQSLLDKNTSTLYVVGQKFSEAQFSSAQNKLSITNNPQSTIYFVEIDSLNEIINRQEFKIPINDLKTGAKKVPTAYLLKMVHLSKDVLGKFSLETDIYKNTSPSPCYSYVNSTRFNLLPADDKLILEKNVISPNLMIEQYFTTTDKLDMNGKLCIDSLTPPGTFFYKTLTLPVKQAFKFDAENNPVWVLGKHTTKKNSVNYTTLGPLKKMYHLTTLEDVSEELNPSFNRLNETFVLLSWQIEEGKYQLKLYNW